MQEETSDIDILISSLSSAEKENNLMYCQKLLSDIISYYRDNNVNKKFQKQISKYKKKLKEVNLALPEQLWRHTHQVEISHDSIKIIVDKIISESNSNTIYALIFECFKIKSGDLKERSVTNSPIFLQLVDMSVIDSDWHSLRVWDENEDYCYYKQYELTQIYMREFMSIVFEKLFQSNVFSYQYLIKIFQNKFIFSSISSFGKFEVWVQRYCEGDFTSSIHVLIPLFEETFLNICQWLWIDIVKLWRWKKITTQNRVFWSEMLREEIFSITFWEDFIEHIDFILFNELWLKLRHRVAHWTIHYSECNFRNNSLILFLFFWLWSKVSIAVK